MKHILLVDDDAASCETATEILLARIIHGALARAQR